MLGVVEAVLILFAGLITGWIAARTREMSVTQLCQDCEREKSPIHEFDSVDHFDYR